MIRSVFKIFLSVAVITSSLYSTTYGTTMCDIEKTLISLKVYNKPVAEILKDIEKQAKYTIKVPSPKLLSKKVSIHFEKAPLNLTLKRLLKDLNHSIICDDEQKTLTLVLLEKSPLSSLVSTRSTTKNTQADSMAEISAAFDDYRNNNRSTNLSSQEDPKEMKGISFAMRDFYNNKSNNTTPTMPHSQKTSMDAVTEAFNQYKINKQNSGNVLTTEDNYTGEMAGLGIAMNEYRHLDSPKKLNQSNGQQTTMDEMEVALEEYKRLYNNK